jgi:hypothetical protein
MYDQQHNTITITITTKRSGRKLNNIWDYVVIALWGVLVNKF